MSVDFNCTFTEDSKAMDVTFTGGETLEVKVGEYYTLKGEQGIQGVTFTPSVSDEGIISWTNDGGLPNPEPVNIKGEGSDIDISDINIPEWAKQPEKPTYTADEVRALSLDEQQLSDVDLDNVRKNMKAIGLDVEGKYFMPYTVDETNDYAYIYDMPDYAQYGAEIYNDYASNIALGLYSKASGYQTQAIGNYSQADGWWTRADGQCAHAEGLLSRAQGHFTHAEGTRTLASINNAHSEGDSTQATGRQSHAEGTQTISSGQNSHAEGYLTKSSGMMSHAEGEGTIASGRAQTSMGKYNVSNTSHRLIVGIGTKDSNRKDGFIVDSSGNGWFAGSIHIGSTGGITKDSGSKKIATEEVVDQKIESVLSFNENGELVVTINGVSKVFVPKE